MKITDLEGKKIQVTDLNLALMQADDFRHYKHIDPARAEPDKKLQAYWDDFYQKLLLLQMEQAG